MSTHLFCVTLWEYYIRNVLWPRRKRTIHFSNINSIKVLKTDGVCQEQKGTVESLEKIPAFTTYSLMGGPALKNLQIIFY